MVPVELEFEVTNKHATRLNMQAMRVWGGIGGPIHFEEHSW